MVYNGFSFYNIIDQSLSIVVFLGSIMSLYFKVLLNWDPANPSLIDRFCIFLI